jgi:hypothetical protein
MGFAGESYVLAPLVHGGLVATLTPGKTKVVNVLAPMRR